MIKLDNITKIYHTGDIDYPALKGISFTINQGELVAIVGPSGSGKTTTMNIMGLLDEPTSGKYYLDDIDTSEFTGNRLAALRNLRLGFIFQQYFLLPKLNALQNVILPLTYRHDQSISTSEMYERAQAMLKVVGMENYGRHKPMELSGGQQQRVAIARALIGKPSIIIADEPTGALDTKTSQEIMDLLKEQMQNTKTTVVIVTHSPELAAECPHEIHIRDGLILQEKK
ncbi:MAG TPA: ABC transporter ATP-binding protein [Coxiellaceae bacterium]|nr:MAG: macrolide ABC transporter ATP-binding protein [Gammaproteobacteria bacterium RIFCSPHIGHO2_12_FULL_36_30]HLB56044.1 ABC transporter ATP-binding protein [Coxiellaceae bacterium]